MKFLERISTYIKMSVKAVINKPSFNLVIGTFKYFPKWWISIKPGKNSTSGGTPWMSFGAIDHIKRIVKPGMIVFEYGSGGSTLFWAATVKKVVSIEHDRLWFDKMTDEFNKRKLNNVEYILSEPTEDSDALHKSFENPGDYISSDSMFRGKNFENYVKQIDRFPQEHFDIIVVDGRARPSCILHAIIKLKKGGYLIVDNSERDYYLSPFTFALSKWKAWKFYGAVPYGYNFSETAIFQKTG